MLRNGVDGASAERQDSLNIVFPRRLEDLRGQNKIFPDQFHLCERPNPGCADATCCMKP
jgi:hypothetical protein